MRKVVGLTGYAGSGKDYVYGELCESVGAVRVAFADGVRLEVEEVLAWGTRPVAQRWDEVRLPAVWKKPYPVEVRRLLQWWGTEFRRAEDPDYWVKKGVDRIEGLWEIGCGIVVVTDVRFANEAQAIRDLGGIVLQVTAADDIRAERLGGELPPAHASEVIDFETDGTIENDHETVYPSAILHYLENV